MNEIFKNQDEVIGNIKDSARELGADMGNKEGSQEASPDRIVAKKNCKLCYGRGVIVASFPGNNGNTGEYHMYCGCVKEIQ